MIPKIIHYTWFSGEPIPESLQRCIDTWHKVLPDYELRLWDGPALAALGNAFADEAVGQRKWAFAADFLRLYAVYLYGGIWLDTDVEVFRSFDPFLNDGMFIGREYYVYRDPKGPQPREDLCMLTAHCFGAEAGHPFIGECLEYYARRTFVRSANSRLPQALRFDMTIIPLLQVNLAVPYGFDQRNRTNEVQTFRVPYADDLCRTEAGLLASLSPATPVTARAPQDGDAPVKVYPYQWFDQPGYTSMDHVVAIHRVAQSWNPLYDGADINSKSTDLKRKTLGYYKLQMQRHLASWILSL